METPGSLGPPAAARSPLFPAQIKFLLISAAPAGCRVLENVLLPSNMTILKLSRVVQPNLLQGSRREIVLQIKSFSKTKC